MCKSIKEGLGNDVTYGQCLKGDKIGTELYGERQAKESTYTKHLIWK